MLSKLRDLIDRVYNDEKIIVFDYEPEDLNQVDPDENPPPDEGDADSATPPPA